ncbi:ABC transporter-like [Trinorchestia longiramus]|nr:ABC transporter-like [Trinorchestia longiramus]
MEQLDASSTAKQHSHLKQRRTGNHSRDNDSLTSCSSNDSHSFHNVPSKASKVSSGLTYCWQNLNVYGVKKSGFISRKKEEIHILKDVSGLCKAGQFLAIMGASGAGKTTMLNVLTFRALKLRQTGTIAVNGHMADSVTIAAVSAYVQQLDLFTGVFTVREQLNFCAQLRMGKGVKEKFRKTRVEEVMQELSLTKCADTLIGVPGRIKGISGGEKKRLAFACELITDPMMLLCDEPTSGLDSFMALNVMNSMKNLTSKGKTVISTIHQPSSEVFALFDRLLILAEGRVAFLGDVKEAHTFFERLGKPCPRNFNPGDHFIYTLAVRAGMEEQSREYIHQVCDDFRDHEGVQLLQNVEKSMQPPTGHDPLVAVKISKDPYRSNFFDQFAALSRRSFYEISRDPVVTIIKTVTAIFFALIFGSIYFGLDPSDPNGVMDISGALFVFITNNTFSYMFPTITVFAAATPLFLREHWNGLYRTDAYFISRNIIELPIYVILPCIFVSINYYMVSLRPEARYFFTHMYIQVLIANTAVSYGYMVSCLADDYNKAVVLSTPLLLPLFLFGGFYVQPGTIPVYLEWISYLSWFKYGYECLMINEWQGLYIEPPNGTVLPPGTMGGDVVLDSLDINSTPSFCAAAAQNVQEELDIFLFYFSLEITEVLPTLRNHEPPILIIHGGDFKNTGKGFISIMGITGLLPFVKKASRPCFLHEFAGKVAAVDTYCWLHKGAFSCAEKLVRGEETDGSRAKNRALAKEMLREGRVREARDCFQRCVDVTSHMARAVMKACRDVNVDVIVAPYEADAQLAYLALEGFADLVITEDSDLLLFGCEKVLFKMDSHGGGVLVEQQKLHLALGLSPDKFSLELFRNVCILSGCDYLPSLPGIGLTKASKFFSLTSNTDVYNVLCKLPTYLKMPQLEVTTQYRTNFVQAVNTFLYQLVFCPRARVLRPLVQYQDGSDWSDHPYAGAHIGHDKALAIALGNIDLQSGQVVDNFDPDQHQARPMKSSCWGKTGDLVAEHLSIWDSAYDKAKVHARYRSHSKSDALKENKLSAFAVNETKKRTNSGEGMSSVDKKITSKPTKPVKVLDIKTLFTKRKREESKTEDDEVTSKETDDLLALYGCKRMTHKRIRPSKSTATLPLDQPPVLNSDEDGEKSLKQELSLNPFAKKLTKTEKQNNSPVNSSSFTPNVKTTHDTDGPVEKTSAETIGSPEPLSMKLITTGASIYGCSLEKRANSNADCQNSSGTASEISRTPVRKNNHIRSQNTSSSSLIAADQKNDKIRATSLTSNKRIVMKSKYFRPIGSSVNEQDHKKSQASSLLDYNSSLSDVDCQGIAPNFPIKPDDASCVDNLSSKIDLPIFSQSDNSSDEPVDDEVATEVQDVLQLHAKTNVCKVENLEKSEPEFDYEGSSERSRKTFQTSESPEKVGRGYQRPKESVEIIDLESLQRKSSTLSQKEISNLSQNYCKTTTLNENSCTFSCSFDSESFGFTPLSQSASELSQGSCKTQESLQDLVNDEELASPLGTSPNQFSKSQIKLRSTEDVCTENILSFIDSKNVEFKKIPNSEGQIINAVDFDTKCNPDASSLILIEAPGRFLTASDDSSTSLGHRKDRPSVERSEDSGSSTPYLSESPTPSGRETPTPAKLETAKPDGREISALSVIDCPAPLCAVSLASSPSESPRPCISESAVHKFPSTSVPSSSKSSNSLERLRTATSTSRVLAPIVNRSNTLSPVTSDGSSSPYFSSATSTSMLSGCRRPGLSRPSRGTKAGTRGKTWRQLDLGEMFAARR